MLKSIEKLRSIRASRSKATTPGARILSSMLPARGVGWPGSWSADRFEQVMHFRNWNYVSIHTICSKIGQLTPNIAYLHHAAIPGKTTKYAEYIRDFGGTNFASLGGVVTPTTGFMYRKSLGVVKPHEDLAPVEFDHPLRRLIENPNQMDTSYDLFYELQLFMELCGVAYLWMVPNGFGVPCELWVIPSHWVWPRTNGGGLWDPSKIKGDLIDYYEVRPWGGTGSAGMLKFPAKEVLMFSMKSPINKLDGWSPQTAGAMWIDTEESIVKSRWAQMCNQARADVHIEVPGDMTDPDDERISRIEAKFMAKYQGELNYGKPIFTPAGTKVTPLSFSPQEMAYFQSEEQARDMVLALRQFPKTAAGISNDMTFGAVLATAASLCSNSINPRLMPLGLRLTKDLAPRFATEGNPIRIWWDDTSPADPQQVNQDIAQDLQANAITPNEVRALRGRPAYKNGGNDPMVTGPGGMVPLPLNTGEDLTDLGELVPTYPKDNAGENEGGGGMEALLGGDSPPEGDEGGDYGGMESPKPKLSAPRIESPNNGGNMIPSSLPKGYRMTHDEWIENGAVTKIQKERDFSSTQFDLNSYPKVRAVLEGFQAAILQEDLTGDGLETDFHVTVKYGLRTDNIDEVRRIVAGFGPVTITLGKVSLFPAKEPTLARGGKEYDVVKVDVEGEDLRRLNSLLAQLPHKDTFPVYSPHVTLAYVVPGEGEKYISPPDRVGHWAKVTLSALTFSDKDGFKTIIPLGASRIEKTPKRITSKSLKTVPTVEDLEDDYDDEEDDTPGSKGWDSMEDGGVTTPEDPEAGDVVDKGIGDTVQAAGRWLAAKWASLEERYGRKAALAMAVAGIVTMPLPGNITAIIGIAEGIRGINGYFRRELGGVVKGFTKKADEVDMGDEKERINSIADILYHVYGDDAVKFFDQGEKAKAWDEAAHPRGKGGKFIPKGGAEAASAAKENVKTALKKPKTPESHKELTEHLNLLTVKQLAELKKEYQISASGRNKKELVQKLTDRLSKGRSGGEKPEGESPSYSDWAAGERESRKPKPEAEKPEVGEGAPEKPADNLKPTTEATGDKPDEEGKEKPSAEYEPDVPKPTAKDLKIERQKKEVRQAATVDRINRRIDRVEKLMNNKGHHEQAGWMRKLKDHINKVGPDAALSALGDDYGSGDGKDTLYEGKAEDMSWFCDAYLKRNGIIAISGPNENDPEKRLVSSQSPTFGEQARPDPYLAGDFSPVDPTFKDKLQEAKSLPGLESSEDISKIVGKDVTHLSADVTDKMDEKYGKGKWIIKTYGDDAYAGFGIYFPQRIEAIKQDARNTIWTAGENLSKYGFKLGRHGDTGKVFGIVHENGDVYNIGTKEYEETIQGDARMWTDRAAAAAENENGPALFDRNGKVSGKDFMAQPAFEAVGISDAERAKGVTGAEGGKGEGRTHIVTRNGKAELIPHSTWIKGESLPVVFEDENTKAMAQAALDAINALPESERQGQIYAPDIMPSADGFKVVEANPANETGSSGYLGDNPFIIDSYVSSITGRSPAHVRFIRKLLQGKGIE